MEVEFATQKLAKVCNSQTQLLKKFGARTADLIRECLDDLAAIEHLSDMRNLPHHRCHELHGNRKGEFSLDLVHPYRLIFVPGNRPIPRLPDGGIDWAAVTSVVVTGMENTHGK